MWERCHQYSGRDGPESEAKCRFRYGFLLNTVITAFASNAPKLQKAVKIKVSGPHPFFCKYYKLYIQQISERSHLFSDQDGPECETWYRFCYVFLLNIGLRLLRLFTMLQKFKSSQVNGLCPHSHPTPPFVCKYYKLYIQQISEGSRHCVECKARFWFSYTFLLNTTVLT